MVKITEIHLATMDLFIGFLDILLKSDDFVIDKPIVANHFKELTEIRDFLKNAVHNKLKWYESLN